LTCEPRAPFLTYEVNVKSGAFQELRNPAIFSRLLEQRGLDIHTRTDERASVPGKKGFVRMNQNSIININNIAYQSWKTITVPVRFQSMPVKESIINLAMGPPGTYYYNIITTPLNGSQAGVYIEYNIGNGVERTGNITTINLNVWVMFIINNKGTGFDLQIYDVNYLINSRGSMYGPVSVNRGKQLFAPNGTWNPISPGENKNACNVMIGSNGYRGAWAAMYATAAFTYDVAWVHFFDKQASQDDIYREALSNWIYTQGPTAFNKYSTME